MSETKIIVIDDDPTGSQTVHGCLLLTRWDVETLLAALRDDSKMSQQGWCEPNRPSTRRFARRRRCTGHRTVWLR